ncbi:MAG: NADH-quinone oxidoreductase subunit NuoB [Thiohalomonadaceae bacterium]
MLKILNKIRQTGFLTEDLPTDPVLEQVGEQLRAGVALCFHGNLAIRTLDAGSCNACELEIHALNNAYYNIERYGVHFVASPRHADILLVTGPLSVHMETALQRTYAAMPAPKFIIAAGDCASCGGEFGCSYASLGAISNIIPVDASIPGCPPTPLQLMQGILQILASAAKPK